MIKREIKIYRLTILAFLILINSCINQNIKNESKQTERLTFADSLWIDFAKAIESKDLDYLVKKSLDTISCSELQSDLKTENEYYKSEFIFNNHLDHLMHLESLTDKDFNTHMDDSLIHVSYSIKSRQAPEGTYGLIYIFVKIENEFKFRGMILT